MVVVDGAQPVPTSSMPLIRGLSFKIKQVVILSAAKGSMHFAGAQEMHRSFRCAQDDERLSVHAFSAVP